MGQQNTDSSLGSDSGSEAHLQHLKESFKQAANSLTQLYKQSSHSYNVAYQQGKTDAYDEIFAWLQAQQQDQCKNVSLGKFRQHMAEKLSTASNKTQ